MAKELFVTMDAKIIIKSIIDGEELESSNNGSVTFLGDVTLLSYKEDVDGDEIKTDIEISDGCIKVKKSGAIASSMHFVLGEKTDMLYSTPFGDMALTIECIDLSVDYLQSNAETLSSSDTATQSSFNIVLKISYNLLNGNKKISSHELEITAAN